MHYLYTFLVVIAAIPVGFWLTVWTTNVYAEWEEKRKGGES